MIPLSRTSIGAEMREAGFAESKMDFIHYLYIGMKGTNECIFWLELLPASGYITGKMFDSMQEDAVALLKMLVQKQ